MRNALRDYLIKIKSANDGIYLIVGDIGFGVFEEYESKFPKDYLNIGICEANMIGVSAGMAMNGFIPIVYTIVPFLTMRCYEQIRVDIAMHHQKVILVGVGGGLAYGNLGPTHHSFEDIALMSLLPNFNIFAPAQPSDGKEALKLALQSEEPSYIRLGKNGEPDLSEYLLKKQGNINIYCCDTKNADLIVFTYGAITFECIKAAKSLSKHHRVSVVSCTQLKPIPKELISLLINQRKIFSVEEHSNYHCVGTNLLKVLVSKGFKGSFEVIGINDRFTEIVGDRDFLLKHHSLDSISLIKRFEKEL